MTDRRGERGGPGTTPEAGRIAPPVPDAEMAAEIGAIEDAIARFRSGDLPAERFRLFRLGHGIYGQRQPNVHMVRIKIPSGALTARQFEAIGDLAERFSTGVAHLTTRQDVQFHFVALEAVPDLLRGLAAAGLTTREACGNNVRNVTACPLAGDLADEAFDVRPFALATAAFFLRQAFCQQLARKFKVAFSACPEDCAATAIHDIGVLGRARREGGRVVNGFALLVGGGLGAAPFVAQVLDPFVPAAGLLPAIKSILQVYADHGNRRVRTKARVKFVVQRLGIERFRALVEERRAALTAEEIDEADLRRWVPAGMAAGLEAILAGRVAGPDGATAGADGVGADGAGAAAVRAGGAATGAAGAAGGAAYRRWLGASVRAHRDPDRAVVTVMVPLGDLDAAQVRLLAGLAAEQSDGQVRLTREQNLVLPLVRRASLPALHARLAAAGLAEPSAGTALDVVACPGADTCALGITSSKGLARAVRAALAPLAANGLADALRGTTIKISGCPNACAQHHVAAIGLHGAAKQTGGRAIPAYQIHLGGMTGPGTARIGEALDKLPARRVPAAVAALVRLFAAERRDGEAFPETIGRIPVERLRGLLAPFAAPAAAPAVPRAAAEAALPGAAPAARAGDADETLDVDWGQEEPFSTAALGRDPAAPDAGGDPFGHVRADLDQAGRFMDQGLWSDALATVGRARFALAKVLIGAAGRRADSDYETACEMRARVIDRGHADDAWNDLHRDIEAAFRRRRPGPATVRALHDRARALLDAAPAARARVLRAAAAGGAEAENPGA